MINEEIKKWTVSNMFLTPLLKIGRDRLIQNGLVNTYLFNEEEEVKYDNAIYLLFKPKNMDHFASFLMEENERNADIIDEYDYEGGHVMLVYKLPEEFLEDYEKIKKGKYSKVSESFKKRVPSKVNVSFMSNNMTIQHMIMTKAPILKSYWENEFEVEMEEDQELWEKPTRESETFNIKKLKNRNEIYSD